MAPSALGERRAAGGVRLTVSRSLTEARRHRDPAAVENELGEEPRGLELPVAISSLGIRQTEPSPGQSDALAETQRRPPRRGEMTSCSFSRFLATFRGLASLAVFVFLSFLHASMPPCLHASMSESVQRRRRETNSPAKVLRGAVVASGWSDGSAQSFFVFSNLALSRAAAAFSFASFESFDESARLVSERKRMRRQALH